jgi:hypothetical protein
MPAYGCIPVIPGDSRERREIANSVEKLFVGGRIEA